MLNNFVSYLNIMVLPLVSSLIITNYNTMELSLTIDQTKTQLSQVADQLGTKPEGNMVRLPKQYGQGFIRQMALPGGLLIHHYHLRLSQPIHLRSFIPKDVRTYLLNINLSDQSTKSTLDLEAEEIEKNLPKGCFFYSPGIEAYGEGAADSPIDMVILSFPESFLNYYIGTSADSDGFTRFMNNSPKFCVFEDVDHSLESMLREVISGDEPSALDKLEMHVQVLQFLFGMFKKIGERREGSSALHPADLQKLFMISAILKSNMRGTPPSIDALAREAGMSASKLKRGFKQVFGIPPYQYYLKAKMGEAKLLLQSRGFAISEVGHILGYSNLSKFSQAFKKEFGMTPRQYRGTIGS